MSVIETLADFVCGAAVRHLPQQDRDALRLHTADVVLAFLAGRHTSEAAALRRLSGQARGFDTVATATAIVRHTEIDDIHLSSCTTPSAVAVPVALSLASMADVLDPERIQAAILVGTELVVRFGLAINGPVVLYRGIWPTCIAAPLGAAAVASRIWNLDRRQTANALSLALMMAAGRTGRFHGGLPGRWILFMAAIRNALCAAHATQAGFVGDPALLDGPWLANAQGLEADLSQLTRGLGEGSVFPRLSLKPFCTARQALSPTQALIELFDEGLDPRAVDRIVVRVPSAFASMISRPIDPAARASGYVNAGFQMGLAAFRRDRLWDLDRAEVMRDPEVLAFARKVHVEPDAMLEAQYPHRWPAAIEVSVAGETCRRIVEIAHGDADRPLDAAAFEFKARRMLEPRFGVDRTVQLIAVAMAGCESRRACRDLVELFASEQAS